MLNKNHLFLEQLKEYYPKCSNGDMHPKYKNALDSLMTIELSQKHIDFLCEIIISKKHFWEFRFEHLRILLLNNSAHRFDLKNFFFDNYKHSRQLVMKLFFIRGYAIYATEEDLNQIMNNYCRLLLNNHDYINYEYILSTGGLPYLVEKYKYECFKNTLKAAHNEYLKISPLLRGYFTLNSKLELIEILSKEAIKVRTEEYLSCN